MHIINNNNNNEHRSTENKKQTSLIKNQILHFYYRISQQEWVQYIFTRINGIPVWYEITKTFTRQQKHSTLSVSMLVVYYSIALSSDLTARWTDKDFFYKKNCFDTGQTKYGFLSLANWVKLTVSKGNESLTKN